jgi:L-aspartate oxidase
MHRFDFLVIGSGIAGLTYAYKVARQFPDRTVAVVTKAGESESNTKYAQGGIAIVSDILKDSYEQHIEDTLRAGDGLCDRDIVEIVVKEGPARFEELLEWGAEFDKDHSGEFNLGREGGHTQNRILHHKDVTGLEIERTLLNRVRSCKNITVYQQHFAVDLITEHHLPGEVKSRDRTCFGAYIFDPRTEQTEVFAAPITILASGGIGQVYQNTTNPQIATGDGIAMAYRAKARIKHMEFVQFHPTALYYAQPHVSFLISEAVRGHGALLRDQRGRLFMKDYDDRGELASRDIVSRAIDSELKKSGDEFVFLDCRHLDQEDFEHHFPNISRKCFEIGIDLSKDMIPVVPAAHYLCGGIDVDEHGQSTVKNLFVCGECAHTGLHGANRLASNSLLEALVFAHRCFLESARLIDSVDELPDIPEWNEEGTSRPKELILITHSKNELRSIMSDYVGIIRSDERLRRASRRTKLLYEETEELYRKTKLSPQLFELRNMITIAYLIVNQSLERNDNRGGFYKIESVI